MYDLKIINALIPDYNDDTIKEVDICIKNGKIEKIGNSLKDSKIEINASGKVVSPGFIDIHAHEEELDFNKKDPYYTANCALRMGVTTSTGGNCGNNRQDIETFYNYVSKNGSPVNYMMFLGHNYLRKKVGIDNRYRKASKNEIDKMKILIKQNMRYNIVGLSYGIEYSPGVNLEEMIEIASALESNSYLLAAHYRYDCERSVESIKELINLSNETKIPMQVSHIGSCSAFGKMKESLETIEKARQNNIDVLADCYPYDAFCTFIGSAVFDDGCFERWGKTYSDILLAEEPYKCIRCNEELFYKVRKEYPKMIAVAFAMNEQEIEEALQSQYVFVGSDSLYNKSMGHPRGAGTFPRVLSKFVRDKGSITLIEALKKMTVLPANRLGLKNKGNIIEGADADIVIFDPNIIEDKADYNNPVEPPVGIEYVIINGEIAVKKNRIIRNRLGNYINYKTYI